MAGPSVQCKGPAGGAPAGSAPRAPPVKGDEELAALYHWVDMIPLSRPKRNISRDFSDGVLMAELVNSCLPKFAELHNYSPANSIDKKAYNWNTLNQKVFRRLDMRLHPQDIDDVVNARPGAVEKIISLFRKQATRFKLRAAEPDALQTSEQENTHRLQQEVVRGNDERGSFSERTCRVGELLREKEDTIRELQETNVIMKEKIRHLQQLVKLKDERIDMLTQELSQAESPQ